MIHEFENYGGLLEALLKMSPEGLLETPRIRVGTEKKFVAIAIGPELELYDEGDGIIILGDIT